MPDSHSRMPSLVMIHITSTIFFELSIQIHIDANNGYILLVRQKFVHGRPRPFCFPSWRNYSSFEKQINDLA